MIAAGIVIYYPEEERLIDNIKNIIKQVSKVYLYDNGSDENLSLNLRRKFSDKVVMIGNGNNEGLSKALNSIMNTAWEEGFSWVITLDQDSICPLNIIDEYKKYINNDDIAIICPQVIDRRRVYMKPDISKGFSYVEKCITSASLTRISAWKDVGGFDDILFIDLIDDDFCKMVTINGWKIIKVNSIILDQEFGNIQLKSPKQVKFVLFLANLVKDPDMRINISKFTYKKIVDPKRIYYTNRNLLYLNNKHKDYGGIGYEAYHCKNYLGFMFTFNLPSVLRGKHKLRIIQAMINGMKDGKDLVKVSEK